MSKKIMRMGRLAEPVQKRSVFRQLNMTVAGPAGHYGADCAFYRSADARMVSALSGAAPGSAQDPAMSVEEAVNRLAAGGGEPYALAVQILLPQMYEEAQLQADMQALAAAAAGRRLRFSDAYAEVIPGIMEPCFLVTAFGEREPSSDALESAQEVLCPGQTLLVTKWIALAGTAMLARRYEERLREHFPFFLIDHAKEFRRLVSVAGEARAATHFGACAMHALSQGGIFNALWEMAERAGIGLEVELKKIPVKQETIEICEYFDINPYYLYSAGALLIGTGQPEALTARLAAAGIPAAEIGRVTDGRERVIRNGEDCRYLDRPKQDEWYRRIDDERTDTDIS